MAGEASRKFAGESLQSLRDRLMQRSSSVRDQRSTVVQTTAQGETQRVETETIALRHRVEEGSSIAQPLIESAVFPPMIAQMVKIGEETGELEKMLSKVADFYEDEVSAAIKALTSILEPVMIVLVGGIVGFIVVAMHADVQGLRRSVAVGTGLRRTSLYDLVRARSSQSVQSVPVSAR
jgi:hypothetical protein